MTNPQVPQEPQQPEQQPQDVTVDPEIPAAAPGAPAAPRQDSRPRPEYGEYAPEGWEWKPEEPANAQADGGAQASASTGGGLPATVPGVPHNLGVGASLPRKGARTEAQPQNGAPYQGAPGAAPTQQNAQQSAQHAHRAAAQPVAPAQSSQAGVAGQPKQPRLADRIITILLLAVGVLGALQAAFVMMGLSMQFAMMGEVLELENFSAPAWLDTGGKVGGIALLAFFALVLVYSLRRLRTGKLTFWVPLVAGVIVFIAVFIFSTVALITSPELMSALADPDASAKMLEYLQSMSTPSN